MRQTPLSHTSCHLEWVSQASIMDYLTFAAIVETTNRVDSLSWYTKIMPPVRFAISLSQYPPLVNSQHVKNRMKLCELRKYK